MGICSLCTKDKKLIKAHIIPDFMYNGMKDDQNVFHSYKDIPNKFHPARIQTGEFDKEILCDDCDNGILGGKYERYAKSIFFNGMFNLELYSIFKAKDQRSFLIIPGIDYSKMKLFLLSILWRASITKRPFFKEVDLGHKHEKRIRQILYKGIIPDELEYPILATSFSQKAGPWKQVIASPLKIKLANNLRGYHFPLRGLNFLILVNSIEHPLPVSITESVLNKNGELTVFIHKNKQDYKILKSFLK